MQPDRALGVAALLDYCVIGRHRHPYYRRLKQGFAAAVIFCSTRW
jgi:hypothetical protein